VRPAAWWGRAASIARRLLSTGNAELAYRIAAQHGLIEGNAYSEAEFLLGYIALRYMKNPADASDHFSRILTRVNTPYAKGSGRLLGWTRSCCSDRAGAGLEIVWPRRPSTRSPSMGSSPPTSSATIAPPRPVPEPVPDATELAGFNQNELVRAARILLDLGYRDQGKCSC